MQCPPTKPGLKGRKFHFVPAASNTAWVSISRRLNILANSFTKAILMSRCEFSITLAASATFIEGARCVPAVITDWYNWFTFCPISGVEPEVTETNERDMTRTVRRRQGRVRRTPHLGLLLLNSSVHHRSRLAGEVASWPDLARTSPRVSQLNHFTCTMPGGFQLS